MGFEARSVIHEVLDEAIDKKADVRLIAYDLNLPEVLARFEKLKSRLKIIIDDSSGTGGGHKAADSQESYSPPNEEDGLLTDVGKDIGNAKSCVLFSLAFLGQIKRGPIGPALGKQIKSKTVHTLGIADANVRAGNLGLTVVSPDEKRRTVRASFEEWLVGERERLRELALEAIAGLLAHQYQDGAFDAAIGTATQLVTLDPLQASVHRTLMRVYLARGRAGAALRQYQLCVAALSRELGTEPEAETRELYREILRQRSWRPPLPTSTPPSPAAPRAAEMWSALTEAPLVNRETETDALLGALKDVEGGHGRAVLMLGEAGIGKSRLLAEFARAAASRGCAIAPGRAYSSTQILPFGAWLPVLQTDGLAADRALLEALPGGVRADLARLLPEFEEPGQPRPSGPAEATRLFEAVAQLLATWSRRQPLVVVLEDLHWADEMSLRLLAFIARRLSRRRPRRRRRSWSSGHRRPCRGRAGRSRRGS